MSIRWEAAGRSDPGRVRQQNEDHFLLDPARGLFLVADGMGGHAAGEIASELAARTVGEMLGEAVDRDADGAEMEEALRTSFAAAHRAIVAFCARSPRSRGMGTTLTACILRASGTFHLGHIGDSRAYRLREGTLEQLTRDHTWVQEEVDAGRLSPAAARAHRHAHVITRALSAETRDEPDVLAGHALPGDLLLLASDGLTGMLGDAEIAHILGGEGSLDERTEALIREANRAGGADNITVLLVRVGDG